MILGNLLGEVSMEVAKYAAQNAKDLVPQATSAVMGAAGTHLAVHAAAGTACAAGGAVGLVAASPVIAGAIVVGGGLLAVGALVAVAEELMD